MILCVYVSERVLMWKTNLEKMFTGWDGCKVFRSNCGDQLEALAWGIVCEGQFEG
jgi:hypothetical protein